MSVTVRTEGFRELEAELEKLASHTTRRASARRALRKAAEPLVTKAQALAPRGETGQLSVSIGMGTRLSKRQQRLHRRMFGSSPSAVELFIGAGPLASAHTQEFGTRHHAPQAFLRPAWDGDKNAVLERIKTELWADIQKAVARAERRAARLAARG